MFSFFKKKPPPAPADPVPAAPVVLAAVAAAADSAPLSPPPQEATPATARQGWLSRLTQGLRKTDNHSGQDAGCGQRQHMVADRLHL